MVIFFIQENSYNYKLNNKFYGTRRKNKKPSKEDRKGVEE